MGHRRSPIQEYTPARRRHGAEYSRGGETMGLLDTLVNTATSALAQSQGSAQGQGANAIDILEGLVQQHGGLGGLLDTLRQQGLGSHVDSWIGTGQNMPVNAQHIIDALGQGPL